MRNWANKIWDDLASIDPLWAVLTKPEKKGNKWDTEDFLETGKKEIGKVIAELTKIKPDFKNFGKALDYGCGAGRLTGALASKFEHAIGVDISPVMIKSAKKNLKENKKVSFQIVNGKNLSNFRDNKFDFVYSNIALQHIGKKTQILKLISEFTRIIKPGGAIVFQLPSFINFFNRLQFGRRLYSFLKMAGFPPKILIQKFNLNPMVMTAIKEQTVKKQILISSGKLLKVKTEKTTDPNGLNSLYFITK